MITNKLYIGMDLHKNSSTFCVKTKDGQTLDSSKVVTNPYEIKKYGSSSGYPPTPRELAARLVKLVVSR